MVPVNESLQRSDRLFLRSLPWERKAQPASEGSSSTMLPVQKSSSCRRFSLDDSVTLQGSSSFLQGSCGSSEGSLTVKHIIWDGDESANLNELVLPRHGEFEPSPVTSHSMSCCQQQPVPSAQLQHSQQEPHARSSQDMRHHRKSWLYDRSLDLDESSESSSATFFDDTDDATSQANPFEDDVKFNRKLSPDKTVSETIEATFLREAPRGTQSCPPTMGPKRVQFGLAHVREYRVVVDAPPTSRSQGRRYDGFCNTDTCPLTLDWSHSPVEFVYPALALGYQSYFRNMPCRLVKNKRLRLCQLHDLTQEELRLRQSQAIATRVVDLILESASWPLIQENKHYLDAEDPELSRASRWEPRTNRDLSPFNERAASLTMRWERVFIPKCNLAAGQERPSIPLTPDSAIFHEHHVRRKKRVSTPASCVWQESLATLPVISLDEPSCSLVCEESIHWEDIAEQAYNDRVHRVEETQEELHFGGDNDEDAHCGLLSQLNTNKWHTKLTVSSGLDRSRHLPCRETPHALR